MGADKHVLGLRVSAPNFVNNYNDNIKTKSKEIGEGKKQIVNKRETEGSNK